MEKTMLEFLTEHAGERPVSFHMPGHKGGALYRQYGYGGFLDNIMDCDITEIPGADNLFQTEGILKGVQERYARLYETERSYMLVNGSSGGLIAAVLAAVPPGKKLIMARNCHKSVFNALALGHIAPLYAYPQTVEEYGIAGSVPPEEIERLLAENPDAEAVLLPSPNYYGICSDIEAIAGVVHRAGKALIVDQAHGAHLKFFHKYGFGEGLPRAAEELGADISVNSIHKTLASFTQSALLNLNSRRVDRYVLEDKLQAVQSTSPSYLLMASLEINAELVEKHGTALFGRWRRELERFYDEAAGIPGLRVLAPGRLTDWTKINLDLSACGIDGGRLERLLMERGIYPELYTGNVLMLMTGIGNTKEDMERTLAALREIAAEAGPGPTQGDKGPKPAAPAVGALHPVPAQKEFVSLDAAAGRVCAGSVIPYPPGIPLICPGEEITPELVSYVRALRDAGEKVIGVNDRGQVLVGK